MSTPKRTYELLEKQLMPEYVYGPFRLVNMPFKNFKHGVYRAYAPPTVIFASVATGETVADCIADLESKLRELRKSHPELMGEI